MKRCHVTLSLSKGACAAAIAAIVGVTSLAPGAAIAQELPTIHIGTTPIDAGAEPYYAQAMGFFKAAGINVEIQAMANGAVLSAGVASGAIDIGQSNVVSLSSAHERGVPFVIVAPASLYTSKQPQSALVVSATSPLKTAKDLNGKTIAVNGLKTISQLGPEAWIDGNGGDIKSVKFIELPFPAMEDALTNNRVDAALISEPNLTEARLHGLRVLNNVYDSIGKDFLIGAWFTTSAWAKAHPDLVRKYIAVIAQTAKWANTHHAESAKILEAETKTPVTATTQRVIFGEALDPAPIQALIDACAKYGIIKERFPVSDILAR
jgi:NitT/TauT family transport system substrate-binding protein